MAVKSDSHYLQNRQRAQALADQAKKDDAQRQDDEYQYRANSRRRDDDEMLAMCGIGRGPNLSNPPMRRY